MATRFGEVFVSKSARLFQKPVQRETYRKWTGFWNDFHLASSWVVVLLFIKSPSGITS